MWVSAKRLSIVLLATVLLALGQSQLVDEVRTSIAHNDFQTAAQIVQSYQSQRGETPELAEAVSWLARGELAGSNYDAADQYAKQAYTLATKQLAGRSVDVNENLATALGAAIEVHAQVLAGRGNKAAGAQYLRTQLAKYSSTSIGPRIQKNLNLLTLPGWSGTRASGGALHWREAAYACFPARKARADVFLGTLVQRLQSRSADPRAIEV